MKTAFTLILSFVISLQVLAQDNTKVKDIKRLLDLTGAVKIGIQAMNTSIETQKKANSSIPQEFWDEFKKRVTEEAFVEMISPIYDKHYTHQEITELILFYQTPIGKKTIAVLPLISQESMAVGQEMGKRIALKIVDEMKANGKL
jgi:uncharacterized protein